MNITNIPYSVLSIEAVLELAAQAGTAISSEHPDDALLSSSLSALDAPKQQATLAIGSSSKQELTEKVNEADLKRDRCFLGFRKHAEAEQYNDWTPAKQQAAGRVLGIVRQHGTTLQTEGMTVQSALLTSLLADLDTVQSKADLTTLSLSDWITKLTTLQSEFATVFSRRNELESTKDIPTKAEAKDGLVGALTVLFNGLSFLAGTQSDTYGDTQKLVSEIADRIVTSER